MTTTIYKPSTYKGPVVLVPAEGPRTPPVITLPDGQQIVGKYYNTNEGRHQFVFPSSIIGLQNLQISYNGQTSTIGSGAQSYEGASLSNWQPRAKGSIGSGMSGGGAGGFNPVQVGQFGFAPANMMGSYPSPVLTQYNPIQSAPYKFTDVKKFAQKYGEFNRGELLKNYGLSKELSLDTLGTELQSLKS